MCSDQSRPIGSREELEEKEKRIIAKYEEVERIERPKHWGGWRLVPKEIEFWKGR